MAKFESFPEMGRGDATQNLRLIVVRVVRAIVWSEIYFVFVACPAFFRYGLVAKLRKSRHLHEESLERWRPPAE